MKTYYVYILKCSDDSYYVGVTNNLGRRISEHSSGVNPRSYTSSRRPVELVFFREFKYIDKAIAFEKQMKRWGRSKKEAIINEDIARLKLLSECQNETHWRNRKK